MRDLPANVQSKLLSQGAHKDSVFSLDNRRLYAAKEAGASKIPSRWATPHELSKINLERRFSTKDGGRSIKQGGVVNMDIKEIQTKYGVIYGRDALILSGVELRLYPFSFIVNASLALSACKPEVLNVPDVKVAFIFNDIKKLFIYKVDEYPYEKHSKSSFDYVDEAHEDGEQHIILSTYDHVFDIVAKYEIEYY